MPRHDAGLFDGPWCLRTRSTSPLLRSETISAGLRALEGSLGRHDSPMSVTRRQTRLYNAAGQPVKHAPEVLLRTRDLPPIFEENSGMYVFTRERIAAGRRFGDRPLLCEIDPIEATGIDTETNFMVAEAPHRPRQESAP